MNTYPAGRFCAMLHLGWCMDSVEVVLKMSTLRFFTQQMIYVRRCAVCHLASKPVPRVIKSESYTINSQLSSHVRYNSNPSNYFIVPFPSAFAMIKFHKYKDPLTYY